MFVLLSAIAFTCFISLAIVFSSMEITLITFDRARLQYLANRKNKNALKMSALLENTEQVALLLSLAKHFVKSFALINAALFAEHYFKGEFHLVAIVIVCSIIILMLTEIIGKTMATLHPERIAYSMVSVLKFLFYTLYPLAWLLQIIHRLLLWGLGTHSHKVKQDFNIEQLRNLIHSPDLVLPHYQRMFLNILELERAKVEDVMIPRHHIIGIDLTDSLDKITEQLSNCYHSRLPLFISTIDNIVGIIHLRRVLALFKHKDLCKETLRDIAQEVYFIPEGTPLIRQLFNFQKEHKSFGLILSEYGDIVGLVTLEDILQELVGGIAGAPSVLHADIHPQTDGSYLVDANIHLRELNRTLQWHLPTEGARTLNGLLLNYLEIIPEAGASLRIEDYLIEIIQTSSSGIKIVKISEL